MLSLIDPMDICSPEAKRKAQNLGFEMKFPNNAQYKKRPSNSFPKANHLHLV